MLEKAKQAAGWPRDQWLSRHKVDYLIVAAVLGGHGLLRWRFDVDVLLGATPMQNRPGLYAASAFAISLSGTIASIAVGQFLSAKGTRVSYLKTRHADELSATWKSIFYGSIIATVLILTAYGFDSRYTDATKQDLGPSVGAWIFEAAAILAVLRLLRLVALFGDLVDVIVKDETDPLDRAPLEFNSDFFNTEHTARH